jgi:hypothetical protein
MGARKALFGREVAGKCLKGGLHDFRKEAKANA